MSPVFWCQAIFYTTANSWADHEDEYFVLVTSKGVK